MGDRSSKAKNIVVLLVEDNESVSHLVERCFHQSSRVTDIVTHLLDGANTPLDDTYLVEELRRRRYDCLLMELCLPRGNDGIALSEAVRQRVVQPPPILLLAADITDEQRERARSAGVYDILDRDGLTPEALRRVVEVAVIRQRALLATEPSV